MFTLDTNIVIYYAAGDKEVATFLSLNQDKVFYLPSIVATEFLSYPLIDAHTKTLFEVISLDYKS